MISTSSEPGPTRTSKDDGFVCESVEQIRVLRLEPLASRTRKRGSRGRSPHQTQEWECVVEIWQRSLQTATTGTGKKEWQLVETRTPSRRGKPLPLIPFVFHGPRHSLPDVDKIPLADIIAKNLDHYRLDADYKHGMHFIGYDYVTGALGVQFHQNPKAYILANVPYSLFTQFLNASSHGAFWNRYLRGKFR